MKHLHTTEVQTPNGKRIISVIAGSVLEVEERIDVLTVSAFVGDYLPLPGTMFGALYKAGIDVGALEKNPYLDLRDKCGVWLSENVDNSATPNVARIGCVEIMDYYGKPKLGDPLESIKAYFRMLELAGLSGANIKTISLPLIGGGDQGISPTLTLIPIVNECLAFLRRNPSCERILFVDINEKKAEAFADTLSKIYSLQEAPDTTNEKKNELLAFISYSTKDRNIADNLCNKLESRGIKVWYAPRNVGTGTYASAIMGAISRATHFIVIVSENSLASQHVLNEIDNAHTRLPQLKFKPLRLNDIALTPEFAYYLSRQHWMDAIIPPIEERLEQFVDIIAEDL